MENQVLKAIRERRSVRKFKSQQITDEELTAVLEAGTYAPTGKGLQDPWIVAVQNEEIKAQLIRMNAEVMGCTGNPYYDAPTLVLVFASNPEQWPNAVQDDAGCACGGFGFVLDKSRTANVCYGGGENANEALRTA